MANPAAAVALVANLAAAAVAHVAAFPPPTNPTPPPARDPTDPLDALRHQYRLAHNLASDYWDDYNAKRTELTELNKQLRDQGYSIQLRRPAPGVTITPAMMLLIGDTLTCQTDMRGAFCAWRNAAAIARPLGEQLDWEVNEVRVEAERQRCGAETEAWVVKRRADRRAAKGKGRAVEAPAQAAGVHRVRRARYGEASSSRE